VLGGGAAGLMCAAIAGARGRSVAVLERNAKPGEKIRISGGGRCNFTNTGASPANYLSTNPHFCKSALARFTPADFIRLVEEHGIAYHEKKAGQLFCDGSSTQIIDLLETECLAHGVRVMPSTTIREIEKSDRFHVATSKGLFTSNALVVATGGLSIPKLGATDFGYRVARHFEIPIVEPRPGLVPLRLSDQDNSFCAELSGVSLNALVTCNGTSFHENILLTHRGLSGPAILQASSYWAVGDRISINLSPDTDLIEFLHGKQRSSVELTTALAEVFPRRFAKSWCERNLSSMPVHHFSSRKLETIAADLHNWSIRPEGTEGFGKAEVTVGGVDTRSISSKTMEANGVRGLFMVGEVLDVTGQLGGYNFQWAWASGFAAGSAV
jgi:predicted Rossmann fold flavoprotein